MNETDSTPALGPQRVSSEVRPSLRRLGIVCLLLAVLGWSLSLPLHCPLRAALVGGCAFANGGWLGLGLAMVTRARRPARIYFWLLMVALGFWPLWHEWPLWHGWPIGDPATIQAWPGASPLIYTYYDVLRFCLCLLGLPYPFARYGQHGPDPLPPSEPMNSVIDHEADAVNDRNRNASAASKKTG